MPNTTLTPWAWAAGTGTLAWAVAGAISMAIVPQHVERGAAQGGASRAASGPHGAYAGTARGAVRQGAIEVEAPPRPARGRIEFTSGAHWPAASPPTREVPERLRIELDGLESPQAAQILAESWRGRIGEGPSLDCWVRGYRADEAASAAALLVLSACDRVLIAL